DPEGGGGGAGSSSSDDLGAPDELIAFQDEGDEQDKGSGGRGSAHGDLDELKSSLVHESENRGGSASGSDSEVKAGGRRRGEAFQKPRQQDGGFFKGTPYPSYPFLMIPELGSPYLPSGTLSPSGARTVSTLFCNMYNIFFSVLNGNSNRQSLLHLSARFTA
uniref:CTNNB1 binding N-teminal domain-containing protein n=1 Tax=Laticauda laticaudata TaxID=8630 RepID=A0A8C5WPU6_LATLA